MIVVDEKKKAAARPVVAQAIKSGELVRRPCEVCGDPRAVARQRNYDLPLDVQWLCHLHHCRRHAAMQPKLTDALVSLGGETFSIADWAARHRMYPSTLYHRIFRLGWPFARQ